jgi:uncharacterized membrane protein
MKTTLQRAWTRLQLLIVAVLVTVVAPQLIASGTLDWEKTVSGAAVALGYWILSTFKDFKDPSVPNSNEPQV